MEEIVPMEYARRAIVLTSPLFTRRNTSSIGGWFDYVDMEGILFHALYMIVSSADRRIAGIIKSRNQALPTRPRHYRMLAADTEIYRS